MKKSISFFAAMFLLCFPLGLLAQATITGSVSDAETGEVLAGANVVVEGTTLGAAADANGSFSISNVPAGTHTVTASVIGYELSSRTVTVPSSGSVTVNFALESAAIELSALEVLAWRATRDTPVAFTNISKADMEVRLGSRDIPLVLNTTPSVYATAQGGGAGDARMNVRGFDQRNVAIMLNGVPVNDMENAWVYWSNWDGVGDATQSIQLQRGLSTVSLATPSIGGTMNIITDAAAMNRGFKFKQEIGNWGFLKSTFSANTGLINDKYAFSGTVVKKTGDGYYNGTWTDAWAYFIGASYNISQTDRLEFYAIGAPQRHGQNLYKQNIGAINSDFARDLDGYDEAALDDFSDTDDKMAYNENYNTVSSSYNGQQYWSMYTTRKSESRFNNGFLNERENFFHKPQVNLNWYHTFSDQLFLSSVFYWSGGKGGGTGTYGRMDWDRSGPSQIVDWDATISRNADSTSFDKGDKAIGESVGILRNSVNQQWTIGAISKLNFDLSENVRVIAGLDWRTAEIGHWREVRDLLGGDYFDPRSYSRNRLSDFWTSESDFQRKLGDKIAYHNTNTVDWLGFFGQGEYSGGPITAYGMFGYSTIKYSFVDHFADAGGGKELKTDTDKLDDPISATQLKGGVTYRMSDALSFYGNFGLVEKVPIFDFVIDDGSGRLNYELENEKFTSIEAGVRYNMGFLNLTANYYNTGWKDRSFTQNFTNIDGEEGLISLTGVNANHSGIEAELAFQLMSMFRLDAAFSLGNWVYTEDANGKYRPVAGVDSTIAYNFYIKDLKVGDAPQTQFALAASVFPIPGLMAQLVLKTYSNHYAEFSPFSRTDESDRVQSWYIPNYSLVDFHSNYNLPIDLGGIKLQAFVHIFNLLDTEYIQDAVDNSSFNAYRVDRKIVNSHKADAAEVFFGMPRSVNIGLSVAF
ncbi:MAG: TonB-dependent receptor [Candidatus Marinimicrobia bacterium]|nr:TonB-dependent receptor [Candidatus Neomarinimicrobiota bacterium]